MKMEDLPSDVVNIILEYTGKFGIRRGVPHQIIEYTDERYDILRSIPPMELLYLDNDLNNIEPLNSCYFLFLSVNRNKKICFVFIPESQMWIYSVHVLTGLGEAIYFN